MKTIQERWKEFEARVISHGAPAVQRQEMRIAFFAGFGASLVAGLEVSELPDDQAVAAIGAMHTECKSFGSQL